MKKEDVTLNRERLIRLISKEKYGFEDMWIKMPKVFKDELDFNLDDLADAIISSLPSLLEFKEKEK